MSNSPYRLTADRSVVGAELAKRIRAGKRLLTRGEDLDPFEDWGNWPTAAESWDDGNRTLLARRFAPTSPAMASYDKVVVSFPARFDPWKTRDAFLDMLLGKVACLETIRSGLDLYEESVLPGRGQPQRERAEPNAAAGSSIFVVHGRNEERRLEVTTFLASATRLRVIVLREQPNQGRTIIEKFEANAATAAFAVVLLTADDVGSLAPTAKRASLTPRARQNVVFELGFFMGLLGRSRVAVLYEEGIELPSDMNGILYTFLDTLGAWKSELARELKAAGVKVSLKTLPV